MLEPLVRLAPLPHDSAITILTKARQFLLQCARAENKLDRLARSRLVDDIEGMLGTLELTSDSDINAWQWLEALPIESRIFASGPQPGCLHLAPLDQGGQSGRRNLFIVGLDDGSFPKRPSIDPILLDAERTRLSASLSTALETAQYQQQSMHRVLFRLLDDTPATVTFSYASRNLAEDRANYPSSSMLEVYRITSGKADANMEDLLSHLGPAVSFASDNTRHQLRRGDSDLVGLLLEADELKRSQLLETSFPHLGQRRVAMEMQAAPKLSAFDGWVKEAGVDLNPTASDRRVSPSRLEALGGCPRRYFFKYGLGVSPPDEWNVDQEKWLDAIQFGNFVHELFEDFLRGLTKAGKIPNYVRDIESLREVLGTKIERLKLDVPVPNDDAFRRQCAVLDEVCEIFLLKEQEYCESTGAVPWVLEASIGLDDELRSELDCAQPVELTLSDGRVLRLAGRIDRVDKFMEHGSERYAIWDYKSGSDFGFSQENPLQNGRKLQPFLYIGMLRHRIASLGGKPDAVTGFGYFFPSPKAEGRKIQWTAGELKRGDEILMQICDLIQNGAFIATTDPQDCDRCDYISVCRDPQFVADTALRKSKEPCNKRILKPWIELRELDLQAETER